MSIIEVGWSSRSAPHAIAGYPDQKPTTACGKTLSGLSGSIHVDQAQWLAETDRCPKCRKALTADREDR